MSSVGVLNFLRKFFTRLTNLFSVMFLIYSSLSLFRLPRKHFPRWFWLKCPSSWCHTISGRGGPPWNCQKSRQCRFRLALATCSRGVKESCLQPHSPLHSVGAQCLEIAPVTPLLSSACTLSLWSFLFLSEEMEIQKNLQVREVFDLVSFLSCNSWHIVTHHTTPTSLPDIAHLLLTIRVGFWTELL